jgi:hypothetical protein
LDFLTGHLVVWSQDNNLSLNLIKTKDYRKRRTEHAPILIDKAYSPFRRLKRFGIGPQILKRFYSCTSHPSRRMYRG